MTNSPVTSYHLLMLIYRFVPVVNLHSNTIKTEVTTSKDSVQKYKLVVGDVNHINNFKAYW
jgi:hypothetical protein